MEILIIFRAYLHASLVRKKSTFNERVGIARSHVEEESWEINSVAELTVGHSTK